MVWNEREGEMNERESEMNEREGERQVRRQAYRDLVGRTG